MADTGVNPYHKAFYRPQNTVHPCRWVTGFKDCSIPALHLSIGKHKDLKAAFAADQAVWASVREHQWYWIPKTNIIGAVCDQPVSSANGPTGPAEGPVACIFDESYHGTATASAVVSEAPDALLLVHEGDTSAGDMPTAPVRPDIQSHSWGPVLGYVPTPLQVIRPIREDPCPVGRAGPDTLVFLAAGNEVPSPSLLDCQRSRPEVQVVGGGYPGYWQANSWTVYDFASWYCRPAAEHVSVDGLRTECGTSFSAPTAAGAAAAALLRIRRHDRYAGRSTRELVSASVSRDEFVEALRSEATYSPRSKFPDIGPCPDPSSSCYGRTESRAGWAPLPHEAPYLAWGYGWLDSTVSDAVAACAVARRCSAKSDAARTYNDHRQQARSAAALHVLGSPPDDDAGSGRDAGADAATAVGVAPRGTYQARLSTPRGDWEDAYAVRARAGQRLRIATTAQVDAAAPRSPDAVAGCWVVLTPRGELLTPAPPDRNVSCDATNPDPPKELRLPETGRYVLMYKTAHYLPHDYRFALSLT